MPASAVLATELNEHSVRYPGWRVALASALCLLVGFASLLVYTFGVFLKPVAAEFHWSRQAVSSAFAIAALCVAACSPLLGALLDRYPVRRIILPCVAIFGCGFTSLALLTNHLASLCGIRGAWHRRQRHGALSIFTPLIHLVY